MLWLVMAQGKIAELGNAAARTGIAQTPESLAASSSRLCRLHFQPLLLRHARILQVTPAFFFEGASRPVYKHSPRRKDRLRRIM
jgi:hypothetical protein